MLATVILIIKKFEPKETEFMLNASNEKDTVHYYKGVKTGINRIIKLIERQITQCQKIE